jgi:type I restriction enzyme, S subunit
MIDVSPNHMETITRVLATYVPACEVRAFGSRATWTAKDYSDLDLAVVCEKALEPDVLRQLREAFEASDLPFRVDVLDWHTISASFQKVIEKNYEVVQKDDKHSIDAPLASLAETRLPHVPSRYAHLPAGWAWLRLDDACEGIFDCPHSTPKLVDAGPFVARSQDIITGVFRAEQAARVSEETYKERTSRVVPARGDLLYSREGTYFGIAAEVPEQTQVCLGQRMVLIRPKSGIVDFRFLCRWLNSPSMASHIHGYRDGTVAERLNLPTIRALPVVVPPLPEQRAIAHILGMLDDKIELNRRMNETLEAMARALFKSWFVDFDPVRAKSEGRGTGLPKAIADLFPSTFEGSELGKIPKGWAVGSIDDDFDLTMGQSPPGETYNDSGVGLPFYQGCTDFGFRFPTRRIYCTTPSRQGKAGDSLVSVRAPVGEINMATEDCAIGRGVAAVRHKTGSRSYTYQFMRSIEEVFAQFEAEGTVFGSIGKKDFHGIICFIPPRDLVLTYEALVSPLDDRLEVNARESRTLASLRDTLLPKLISGELRIRAAERFVETTM